MHAGRLQQDVGAVRVVEGEGEGVAERVVDMGLRGKVHDGVHRFIGQDKVEQVGGLDVAFDELWWSGGREVGGWLWG